MNNEGCPLFLILPWRLEVRSGLTWRTIPIKQNMQSDVEVNNMNTDSFNMAYDSFKTKRTICFRSQ